MRLGAAVDGPNARPPPRSQSWTPLPRMVAARVIPSGEKAMPPMAVSPSLSVKSSSPLATSQSWIFPA